MDVLPRRSHQLAGFNSDLASLHVRLDVQSQSLTLSLGFACPRLGWQECVAECAMKDRAAERRWRQQEAVRCQATLNAWIPCC